MGENWDGFLAQRNRIIISRDSTPTTSSTALTPIAMDSTPTTSSAAQPHIPTTVDARLKLLRDRLKRPTTAMPEPVKRRRLLFEEEEEEEKENATVREPTRVALRRRVLQPLQEKTQVNTSVKFLWNSNSCDWITFVCFGYQNRVGSLLSF